MRQSRHACDGHRSARACRFGWKSARGPSRRPDEILIRVRACGVCRTDLHVVDGELPHASCPIVPGHEIVGAVERVGAGVRGSDVGERVGVPWLGSTCGALSPTAATGRENLCDAARFTGYDIDGGYAEYAVADARFCFRLPERYGDAHAAPLLCAGLIGYRAYAWRATAARLGLYGFGAAAHIVAQVARASRAATSTPSPAGRRAAQAFRARARRRLGRRLGRGAARSRSTRRLSSRRSARSCRRRCSAVRKGGRVVCAGIHMSDIPAFPYAILWGERSVCSVANLTRADGEEFFRIAAETPIRTKVTTFPLEDANEALARLRDGRLTGAAVLIP